jgi:hypothetical protein
MNNKIMNNKVRKRTIILFFILIPLSICTLIPTLGYNVIVNWYIFNSSTFETDCQLFPKGTHICYTLPKSDSICKTEEFNVHICKFNYQNDSNLYQINKHMFNVFITGLLFSLIVTIYLSLHLRYCDCYKIYNKPELAQHTPLSEV